MAVWFAFAIHFVLNHVQNRQYSNGNMEFQEETRQSIQWTPGYNFDEN